VTPNLIAMAVGRFTVELDVGAGTALFFVLIICGIAVFGLPPARWLARRNVPAAAALPLLVTIGAIGGATIAMLATRNVGMFFLGIAPGGGIALIWTMLNFDFFKIGSNTHNSAFPETSNV